MNSLGRDIRTQANILIEQWANGYFYVTKNRLEDKPTPYEIHPNEMVKLLAEKEKVVIVNYKTIGTHMKFLD